MRTHSNHNVIYRCAYHVVWCPKYRRPIIVDDERGNGDTRLKEIVGDVCDELRAELIELETIPDHVHLLVGVDPHFGIHRLVKTIKGRSSRLLRAGFPSPRSRLPTLWTNRYFAAAVGGAPLEVIKQYVANQRNL
ncbi:MAG: IS200/IS605 family transposase [Actinomycetota bacterium]|nr:IS200/IS605 family transposase [Actinomycetota bacterium]